MVAFRRTVQGHLGLAQSADIIPVVYGKIEGDYSAKSQFELASGSYPSLDQIAFIRFAPDEFGVESALLVVNGVNGQFSADLGLISEFGEDEYLGSVGHRGNGINTPDGANEIHVDIGAVVFPWLGF